MKRRLLVQLCCRRGCHGCIRWPRAAGASRRRSARCNDQAPVGRCACDDQGGQVHQGRRHLQDHRAGRQQDHAQRELPAHDRVRRGPGLAPGHAGAAKALAGRIQDPAGAHLFGRACSRSPTRRSASSRSAARRNDTEVLVRTEVRGRGDPIQLDYRLEKTPGQGAGWKIYNLNVLGVWLVETYRSQFAQRDQRQGHGRPDRHADRAQQVATPRRAEARARCWSCQPKSRTTRRRPACRMLAQALRAQPESAVVADASALVAVRFVGAGGAARVPARGHGTGQELLGEPHAAAAARPRRRCTAWPSSCRPRRRRCKPCGSGRRPWSLKSWASHARDLLPVRFQDSTLPPAVARSRPWTASSLRHRGGRVLRPARAQRRGQDHPDQHAGRPRPGRLPAGSACTASTCRPTTRQARRQLGVVPQELVFDPFFNVREALRIQSGYFGVKNNDAWIDELLRKPGPGRQGRMPTCASSPAA